MKQLIIIISLVMSGLGLKGQDWLLPLLKKENQQVTLQDIRASYEQWAVGKDLNCIKGWKWYERCEYFWRTRLDENGNLPNPNHYYDELQRYRKQYPDGMNKINAANWTVLGPVAMPGGSNDTMDLYSMGRINCITFHPTNKDIFWIGSSGGGVWRTDNGGVNWRSLTDSLPVLRISDIAIHPQNPDIMYIATGDFDLYIYNLVGNSQYTCMGSGVFKTVDGGRTWTQTGLRFVQNNTTKLSSLVRKILINPVNPNQLVAATGDGIRISDDAGDTWTRVQQGLFIDMDANPLNPNTIYASAYPRIGVNVTWAGIYKSLDFGRTWARISGNNPLTSSVPRVDSVLRMDLALTPADTNYVYALSADYDNGFYSMTRSTDGGTTWTTRAHKRTSPNIFDWYVGDTLNKGQGHYDLTLLVHPQNKEIVYTGTVNIWGSNDGGATYSPCSFWLTWAGDSALHSDQHNSYFHPLTKEVFIANDGGIYKTDSIKLGNKAAFKTCQDTVTFKTPLRMNCYQYPTKWKNLAGGLNISEYYRMANHSKDPNRIIGGTQDNGTFEYKNGAWRHIFWGDGMDCMFSHSSPDTFYATQYDGNFNRTFDGGRTWARNLHNPMKDSGDRGDWVAPYQMHPDSENVIYTGWIDVWKSRNYGNSWNRISKFKTPTFTTRIEFMKVAKSDPNVIFISRTNSGATSSTIMKTINGGQTWTNVTNPANLLVTGIEIHDADPQRVWLCFGGFTNNRKVYKSINGGTNWTNFSDSTLPNVPTSSIIFQRGSVNEGIYLGTDLGVFYKNNAMTGWLNYSTGLPSVVVVDMEIQYPSQKLRSATYGRGIWESDLYEPSDLTGISKPIIHDEPYCQIYPNPTQNILNIEAHFPTNLNTVEVKIFTTLGKEIYQEKGDVSNGIYQGKIDGEKFGKGLFFVRLVAGEIYINKKVVVE